MEFNKKLQELRKSKGITQEELAKALYVSRTAISKWESGRGYPNIDSLKEIASFFQVTIDDLLSGDEVLTIAEADGKQKEARFRNLIFGLLDISIAMLLFLPLFKDRIDGAVFPSSLLSLTEIQPYMKLIFIAAISLSVFVGALSLFQDRFPIPFWDKNKNILSLVLSIGVSMIFILSLHPYAAAFTFVLLIIKAVAFIKKL